MGIHPFYRTQVKRIVGFAGVCLLVGLAVSLSIIERHRGDIRVRSTPGKGSTFVVWLPADEELETDGDQPANRS